MKDQCLRYVISSFKDLREYTEEIIGLFDWYLGKIAVIGDIPLSMCAIKSNRRMVMWKYSKKKWELIKELIRAGEILVIMVEEDMERSRTFRMREHLLLIACLNYGLAEGEDSQMANEVAVFVSEAYRHAFPMEELAQRMKDTMFKIDGVYGYMDSLNNGIAHSPMPTDTPYELYLINFTYSRDSIKFDRKTRGYYYINLLTQKHIDELGGWETVKANAPCYKAEKLERDGKTIYWLQLMEDVDDYDEKRYLELKEYFRPILWGKEKYLTLALNGQSSPIAELNRIVFTESEREEFEKQMVEARRINPVDHEPAERTKGSMEDQLNDYLIQLSQYQKQYKHVELEILDGADPTGADMRVKFKELSGEKWKGLEKLLNSWVEIGLNGGYGGGYMHDIYGIWNEGNEVIMSMDMGEMDLGLSLTILECLINAYAKGNGLSIQRMTMSSNLEE